MEFFIMCVVEYFPMPKTNVSLPKGVSKLVVIILTAVIVGALVMWLQGVVGQRDRDALTADRDTLRTQIDTLTKEVADLRAKQGGNAPVGSVVSQISVTWNGKDYTFAHRCDGQILQGPGGGAFQTPVQFCIGRNQLALAQPDGTTKILVDQFFQSAAEAPLLIKADALPTGTVLLSYRHACDTDNSCGAGIGTNYVSAAYDLATNRYWELSYPGTGTPLWNTSYTRAVFVNDTCGGAGCDVAALSGFDLAPGFTTDITAEKAAPMKGATDVMGGKLPYWENPKWKDDYSGTVTLVNPSGPKKTVPFKF
jgi:outer membrane murein-binding lipoprotein Lpp